ncbi:MAG: sugar ABC transporter permease [Anaerolineales bacterium]|nr:sugar ABC transporter permease [Anaerolineales bacterium]
MQSSPTAETKKISKLEQFSIWFNQEKILGPALVAPAVLILLLLIAYPFCVAIWLSMTDKVIARSDTGNFIWFANFTKLFKDSIFQRTTINTFNYALVSVFFKLILGLLMALVLDEVKIFKNFFRGILLLPWIVPTSLSALGFLWMFDSQFSILNRFLLDWGLIQEKIIWLGTPATAMISVQLVNIWRGIPFFGISLLAGLQSIPQELYEAADIDGASAWSKFWNVTFPLLMPVTAVVTLFSIVQTFADFQIVYVLTRGGPVNSTHLFATLTHQTAILAGRLGEGAAVSLFMFPILVIAVILQLRYLQNQD